MTLALSFCASYCTARAVQAGQALRIALHGHVQVCDDLGGRRLAVHGQLREAELGEAVGRQDRDGLVRRLGGLGRGGGTLVHAVLGFVART